MKGFFKIIAVLTARLLVLPLYVPLAAAERFIRDDQPFQCCSQLLSLVPGIPGNYLRREFYRLSLAKCSSDCCIGFGTVLHQRTVEIGRRVYIGTNCSIGECIIEDDALLGSNVDVISGNKQHFFDLPDVPVREQGGKLEKITIGEDAWLGNSSVVMANIGRKSIVGAGSVVAGDVEPFSIVAGNPARFIKKRSGQAPANLSPISTAENANR